MTKYWIVVNNDHQGPFTKDELAAMGLSADTYAWHPGLPKWTQARDIAELADIVSNLNEAEPEYEKHEAVEAAEVHVTEEPSTPPPPHAEPQHAGATPPPPPPAPHCQPLCNEPKTTDTDTCPANYLAWSIITTLLFCLPLGIVAIIYASKVQGAWYSGDTLKARRFSERAAWFSNIAFVAGLIFFPFSMAFSALL